MVFFVFLALCGFCAGSFLNVVADRLEKGKSIIKDRSHCETCNKVLQWYELIPIISFLCLRGKCRHCKAKLSLYYPVVELVTGVVFFFLGVIGYPHGLLYLIFLLLISSCFIVLFFSDLKYGILPDIAIYSALFLSFLFMLVTRREVLLSSTLSGAGAFLFFFLLFLLTKGKGMGFGDVKLSFLLGFLLGFPRIVLALYIAFIVGAMVGIGIIVVKKKSLKTATLPFGPFLIGGFCTSLLFSAKLLSLFRFISL